MEENPICLRCSGKMEQGFLVDYKDTITYGRGAWAKGPKKKSFWEGFGEPKNPREIVTYRCTACGYLESYAK